MMSRKFIHFKNYILSRIKPNLRQYEIIMHRLLTSHLANYLNISFSYKEEDRN